MLPDGVTLSIIILSDMTTPTFDTRNIPGKQEMLVFSNVGGCIFIIRFHTDYYSASERIPSFQVMVPDAFISFPCPVASLN